MTQNLFYMCFFEFDNFEEGKPFAGVENGGKLESTWPFFSESQSFNPDVSELLLVAAVQMEIYILMIRRVYIE